MRRRSLVVGTAALLATLAAGVMGGGGTAAEQQQPSPADAAAVRAANAAFYAALSARDIRAMEAVWARESNPLTINPTSRAPAVGWEAVRRSYEEVFGRYAELSVAMAEPEVRIAPGGALVVGVEAVRGRLASGGEAVAFTALGTNVFERRPDGRWLIIHHHASRAP